MSKILLHFQVLVQCLMKTCYRMRFKVLTVIRIMITVFWDVMPPSLIDINVLAE